MAEEIPSDQLMPGHEALVKLVKELGVSNVIHDADTGEVYVMYHNARMDPINVVGPADNPVIPRKRVRRKPNG